METDCCSSCYRMFGSYFNYLFSSKEPKKDDPETSSSSSSEDEEEDAPPSPRKNNKLFKVATRNLIREEQKKKLEIQKKKIFNAAREILTSEKTFVEVLKLLNIDFRNFIEEKNKRMSKSIPAEEFKVFFKNLPQLLAFNQSLLKDFEERIENWDKHPKIADIIKERGQFLRMYSNYMNDFTSMNEHYNKCIEKYSGFKKSVIEFEKLPLCKFLKVTHYMLKPVQRLPQYRMLLDNYLKYLPKESIDFDDTTDALRIVSEAADYANEGVKKKVKKDTIFLLQGVP